MTAPALTLRDLRRLAARRSCARPSDDTTWLQVRGRLIGRVPTWPMPEIDQLIARHGAHALLDDVLAAARPAPNSAAGESPASAPAADGAHCSDPKQPQADTQIPPSPEESHDDHDPPQASAPSTGAVAEDGDEPSPAERSADGSSESSATGAPEEPSASEVTSQPSDGVEGASARDAATPPDDEDASPCGESGARSSSDTEGSTGQSCTEGRPVTEVASGGPDDGASGESGEVASGDDALAAADSASGDDALATDSAPIGPGPSSQHFPPRLLPHRSYGGDHAADAAHLQRRATRLRGDAAAVARALRRLLRAEELCGDDPSPRIDAARLVVELVSRRCSIARATRRELAPRLIILAADCSGSCSAVCDDTLAACIAIASEMPHAIVVRHSNGEVIDAIGAPAARLPAVAAEHRVGLAEIPQLLRMPIACTVAFGDWDAGEQYQALCEAGERLYWLDSYAARSGSRPASSRLRTHAEPWRRQPAGWWQGVNDATTAAFALREMRRP